MKTIRVIGFDLDDTLWDVRPVIMRAERQLSEWLMNEIPGFEYDVDQMRRLRHDVIKESPELVGQLTEMRRRVLVRALSESRLSIASSTSITDAAMEVFLTARNDVDLFDGAIDAIRLLSNDYVLGALTNGNADIQKVGLGEHFNFAFSAEQVGAPKPNSALFDAALRHTAVDPHQMVYVGDDARLDVDAAKRVGLRTIWVKRTDDATPGETEADATIRHIRELPEALGSL